MVCGFEPRTGLCADSSEPGACFEIGRAHVGEGQGERETPESEAGFRLQAVSVEPNVGLKPTNHEIMT